MSRRWSYELDLTKALFFTCLAHRYVHTVMARSFTGKANSTGVVGRQELLFLYSLVKHHHIYLDYVLVDFIAHQGQHICLGTIFSSTHYMTYSRYVMSAFYTNILYTMLCVLAILLAYFYVKPILLEVCLLNIANN